MPYYVYMMASRPGGALYVGSTNNLRRRVEEHRSGLIEGHTKRYNIKTLVWFEEYPTYSAALEQERRIKKWKRAWKDHLILGVNPDWRDVTFDIPY